MLALLGYFGYKNYWPKLQSLLLQTPNIPANWKTYTNTTYKYTFKYPDNWAIQSFEPGIGATNINSTSSDISVSSYYKIPNTTVYSSLRIRILDQTSETYFKAWEKQKITFFNVKWSKVYINKMPAISYEANFRGSGSTVVQSDIDYFLVSPDNKYTVMLGLGDDQKRNMSKTFDQILSTFKFID